MTSKTYLKTDRQSAVPRSALFAVGDLVTVSKNSKNSYEVAGFRRLLHVLMVGIYDEPPSKHVDYWKKSSLTLIAKAKHGHERTCVSLEKPHRKCNCMTADERRRYLAWLNSANDPKLSDGGAHG